MGKASLRLLGPYAAWSPAVREAVHSRDGAPDTAMLVRVDGPVLTEDGMARARNDVKLLSRLRHDHVLRMDFVSAVAGRIGQVYEHPGGAGLSRVIATETAMGRPLPLRVLIEIGAAVATALDEATKIVQGGSRIEHPGPELQDLLIERSGRTKLSGFVVARTGAQPGLTRRRGFSPPEGGDGGPATMTWMAAQFLSELIRASGRAGELPSGLSTLLRTAFADAPAERPAPGVFAAGLREIAAATSSPSIRAWADIPVREALTAGRAAEIEAETVRLAPGEASQGRDRSRKPQAPVPEAPSGASPTIIPDFETEEPAAASAVARSGGLGVVNETIVPDMLDMETEEPLIAAGGSRPRADERTRERSPVQPLPVSVGPSVGPKASAVPASRTRAAEPTRPVSAAATIPPEAFWGAGDRPAAGASLQSRLATGGPTFPTVLNDDAASDESPRQASTGPSMGSPAGAAGLAFGPSSMNGPAFGGP